MTCTRGLNLLKRRLKFKHGLLLAFKALLPQVSTNTVKYKYNYKCCESCLPELSIEQYRTERIEGH